MLCARMQHEGQSSWDRNYPTLTLSPHREVGPNCHCDSRILQKERYHWWVTGKQSEDWQCQQNHNVFDFGDVQYGTFTLGSTWSLWNEEQKKMGITIPSITVQTRPTFLLRKGCVFEKRTEILLRQGKILESAEKTQTSCTCSAGTSSLLTDTSNEIIHWEQLPYDRLILMRQSSS